MRRGPGRQKRSGEHRVAGTSFYAHNQPGSKVARQFIEHAGRVWHDEVFHGGELTADSDKRAGRPAGWARWKP